MKGKNALAIALSPAAVSLPVLLLQTPLALALAFSTRMSKFQDNPIMMLGLAWLYLGGAALCFVIGKWCLDNFGRLQTFRIQFTLGIWFFAGLQSVILSELAHALAGGEQLSLQVRLAYIPLVWIASIYSATTVLQSRRSYLDKFEALQADTLALRSHKNSANQALADERRQLIDTVRGRVKPELESISAEIMSLKSALNPEQFVAVLRQVDDYSLQTLRKQISELNSDLDAGVEQVQNPDVSELPKFQVHQLRPDPARSLRIVLGITLGLMLTVLDLSQLKVALLQLSAIFVPIILINIARTKIARVRRIPKAYSVLATSFIVGALLMALAAGGFNFRATSNQQPYPLVGYVIVSLIIILGAFGKYFTASLKVATQNQSDINEQLKDEVRRSELARHVVHRDLVRILHGPIQGRLAAVRMKLHLLNDSSLHGDNNIAHQEIDALSALLKEVSQDIEALGTEQQASEKVNLLMALDELAYKWEGMLDVGIHIATDAEKYLESSDALKQKIVSACSEAVTNATRHGNATKVTLNIELAKNSSAIQLVAQDNGGGAALGVTAGIGLQDMEADGGMWRFEPSQTGARFCVEFLLTPVHA